MLGVWDLSGLIHISMQLDIVQCKYLSDHKQHVLNSLKPPWKKEYI